MNVSLTRELEEFVRERVATGRYHSASEVVREGLRLLESREQVRRLQMEDLRRRFAFADASQARDMGLRWRASREPDEETAAPGNAA